MPRNGTYSTRHGTLTARSGSYAPAGVLAEMIEDFEEGYPRRAWNNPTWSGDSKHISQSDLAITQSGDGSAYLKGYFEDWVLPENLATPAELGRPIRCWFYPLDWITPTDPDRDGSQYWFTIGHPTKDDRYDRLELNTIYTGTARIRYRNGGTAKTIDSLDGGVTYTSDAHLSTENVWFAWDVYSPGCNALQSSNFEKGETLAPGEWQFALHENGIQTNPTIIDASFTEYQDWPGDEVKIGIWAGRSGDEVIFDDIQFLDQIVVDDGSGGTVTTTIIDDFEEYRSGHLPTNWTIDGSGSADVDSSAALHADSSQGVLQKGSSQIRSFPGQGLDRYPEDGKEFTVLTEFDSDTKQPWILLNLDTDYWSTETNNWRFEFHMNSGIRLVYADGDGRDILSTDDTYSFSTNTTYEAHILPDSTAGMEFWITDGTGNVVASTSTMQTKDIDPEMNIGFRSSRSVRWDYAQIIE